jgi:hypothetical protein
MLESPRTRDERGGYDKPGGDGADVVEDSIRQADAEGASYREDFARAAWEKGRPFDLAAWREAHLTAGGVANAEDPVPSPENDFTRSFLSAWTGAMIGGGHRVLERLVTAWDAAKRKTYVLPPTIFTALVRGWQAIFVKEGRAMLASNAVQAQDDDDVQPAKAA